MFLAIYSLNYKDTKLKPNLSEPIRTVHKASNLQILTRKRILSSYLRSEKMATIDQDTITYLSNLCRIEFNDSERQSLLVDLKKIIGYVEQLNEVDAADVIPCNHVLDDTSTAMREDNVENILSREDFLENAPSHIGGLIKVPTVIKQN